MKGGEEVPAHNEEKSIINEEAEKTKSKTLVRNAKTSWKPSNLLAGQGDTLLFWFPPRSGMLQRWLGRVLTGLGKRKL